jgi:hypothetical protein
MNIKEFIVASVNVKKLIDDYKYCEIDSKLEQIESEGEYNDDLDENKDKNNE